MFDKIKQLGKLKEIKDSLEKEKVESEKEGVKVVINGKMEVEEVFLNPDVKLERQQELLKECFNEAFGKMQQLAAQKMFKM